MELVRRDNRSNNVNRMLIPIPPSDYVSKFSQKPPVSRWVGGWVGRSVRPSVSQSVSQSVRWKSDYQRKVPYMIFSISHYSAQNYVEWTLRGPFMNWQMNGTSDDNEWYSERVTASDNDWYSEWQKILLLATANDKKWHRPRTNERK